MDLAVTRIECALLEAGVGADGDEGLYMGKPQACCGRLLAVAGFSSSGKGCQDSTA